MITRICLCGSTNVAMTAVFAGYTRMTCADCGSTGPFEVDSRTPALQRMTDRELADEVAAFCDEGAGDGG